ncbi:VOC family protein [Aeromicrobium sp.]|uniref:VOC family protein n=1 Tax=Aeromicrobium sp. TaxID=1871063 RepID=UPI003D6B40D9
MSVSLSHCYVAVDDPDLALAFYRDALGLELRSDISSQGFRWVTLSPPSQPELEIVLVEPHSGRDEATGDALHALLKQGSLNGLIFRTDDLEETFEKVRATGADVLQEPKSHSWGVTDCAFRDPSGTMIRLTQR